jgi:hypothetical protein
MPPSTRHTSASRRDRLPPRHGDRMSGLVKTSELHIGDTRVACTLLGHDAARLSSALPTEALEAASRRGAKPASRGTPA